MGFLNQDDIGCDEQIDFENDLVFAPERKGPQYIENPVFEELNNGDHNDEQL